MSLLCRAWCHKWRLAWHRVGEDEPCERGCGAIARATPRGWVIDWPGHGYKTIPNTAPRSRADV